MSMLNMLSVKVLMSFATIHTEIKSEPSVNVFNGTISKMLGCIFAPAECKDLQNSTENNKDLQDQITEEMMEMDSADEKTAN